MMHGPFKHLRYGVPPVLLIIMNPLCHYARCLCTVETSPPHLAKGVCSRGRGGGIGNGMGPQAWRLAIQTAAPLVNVAPVVLWVIGESKSLDVGTCSIQPWVASAIQLAASFHPEGGVVLYKYTSILDLLDAFNYII